MGPLTVKPQDPRRARRFAAALEGGAAEAALLPLVRLAGAMGPALPVGTPTEEFRLALRNRIFAVGAIGVAPVPMPVPAAPWRRRLAAASAIVALATGGAAATAVASSDALPGDRLYEVKRAVEQVQLALAGSELDKGKRYLAIAATRMSEVEALLARNPAAAADPALVEELRDTLSAASAALAQGSERLFAAFGETANAEVLAPLEQFLAERAGTLAEVRHMLPAELLPKQDLLIGELEVLAARVATVTGRAPMLAPASAASPLVVDRPAPRATRAHAARAPMPAVVGDLDKAVAEARADAEREAAAAAKERERSHAKMQRDVRGLAGVDLFEDTGRSSVGRPSEQDSVGGSAHSSRAGSGAGAGSMLLNLLPLPENTIDAIAGSLSSGLDFDSLGGHRLSLLTDR
ncbi:MAG: DUF5667 domain-containing protein [Sporichthyaceae bacterium]